MSTHRNTRAIKRLTLLAKSLHPMLRRIPNPLPRPGTDAFKGNIDAKTAQARQEAFVREDSRRLDKGVIRFFATPFGNDEKRK